MTRHADRVASQLRTGAAVVTGGRQYTVGEVALALRVSTGTVLWWCRRGYIEYTRRPSGHRRFAESEVIRIRATHRPGARWRKS